MRVVKHKWPKEAVDVPSQEVFKARFNGTWSNLIEWKASLPMAWLGTR